MRRNCVTTRVRIYYIVSPRGGGFRTGGTCVSLVVAAQGIITLRRGAARSALHRKGSGRKRLAATSKGIDNGPIISGRRRLSRHAPYAGKRTAGEPFWFRGRCLIRPCYVTFLRSLLFYDRVENWNSTFLTRQIAKIDGANHFDQKLNNVRILLIT